MTKEAPREDVEKMKDLVGRVNDTKESDRIRNTLMNTLDMGEEINSLPQIEKRTKTRDEQEQAVLDRKVGEVLHYKERWVDGKGYLRNDEFGNFIKVGKFIAGGSQSYVFEGEIDWEKADYKQFFQHILAHELAKKDSLEEQLKAKGLKLEELKQLKETKWAYFKENGYEFDARYSLNRVKKEYLLKAKKFLDKNIDENEYNYIIRYLKKRGMLERKNGDESKITQEEIAKIVRKTFDKNGIFEGGRCAIKFARPVVTSVAIAKRAERENSLAGVVHDNLIYLALYGKTSVGNRNVSVADYVDGMNVDELICRLTLKEKADIAKKMANVADLLSRLYSVHRDLKPDNILVSKDLKKMKVIDLGIMGMKSDGLGSLTRLTVEGVVLGTLPYMAPEQAQGLEGDVRSDIFSIGATLYELLTNEPTIRFRGFESRDLAAELQEDPNVDLEQRKMFKMILDAAERPKEVRPHQINNKNIRHNNAEIPGFLSNILTLGYSKERYKQKIYNLARVIAGCMRFSPNKRYQNPNELIEDLNNVAEGRSPKYAPHSRELLGDVYANPKRAIPFWKRVTAILVLGAGMLGATYLANPETAKETIRGYFSNPKQAIIKLVGDISNQFKK